jgi:hypothetical protein
MVEFVVLYEKSEKCTEPRARIDEMDRSVKTIGQMMV